MVKLNSTAIGISAGLVALLQSVIVLWAGLVAGLVDSRHLLLLGCCSVRVPPSKGLLGYKVRFSKIGRSPLGQQTGVSPDPGSTGGITLSLGLLSDH